MPRLAFVGFFTVAKNVDLYAAEMARTPEFKAVFLDLNDTVVGPRPDDRPSKAVIESSLAARDRGIRVIGVTGLPAVFAQRTFDDLGINSYCLVNGGAEVYSPRMGLVVDHTSLTAEEQPAVEEIFDRCNALKIPVYSSQSQYGMGEAVAKADELDSYNTKLFLDSVNAPIANKLAKEFRSMEGIAAYCTPSWKLSGKDVHITEASATKANVDLILDLYNIKRSEAVAVGDSELDLPMLTLPGIGLAAVMRNAPASVRKKVEMVGGIVLPSMKDDGVSLLLDEIMRQKPGEMPTHLT